MPTISIRTPQGVKRFELRRGLGLQALGTRDDPPIEFDCREADCGICIFKVEEGAGSLSPQTASERDFLKAMRADPDERLACQCRVFGDVSIFIEDA